jgi:hypothetical protein
MPSGFPSASSALTARYGRLVFAEMAVSKPLRVAEPTRERLSGVAPASNSHEAVPVEPFQLAYTVTPPPPVSLTDKAGAWEGCPSQAARYAR